MKGGDGDGKWAGEVVVAEEEGLEVGESGEVREGTREGVILKAEDAELVEAREGAGGEGAAEAGALEDEADNAALGALDAPPLAEVEALGEGVEQGVVEVGGGLEGKEGGGVIEEDGAEVVGGDGG